MNVRGTPRELVDTVRSTLTLGACLGLLILSGPGRSVSAAEPAEAPAPAAEDGGPLDEFLEALTGGKFSLNLRLRAEIVEQDATDTSQAYTGRLRLGYTTGEFYGFSLGADVEDVHSLDPDLYNAAGLNGQGNKAVVADPEDTELNQFFLKYARTFEHVTFQATLGRQRLILDDARFVGNVGWRQNEQTYDAYTFRVTALEDISFLYSYIDDVNRIFGPDSGRDFDSDSHLLNLSYTGCPVATVTAFAYLLDLDSPALSTTTLGLRISGSQDLNDDLFVKYAASYARQVDAENNPGDYEVDYYFVEGGLGSKGIATGGIGYEVLGSDGGQFAFSTPLATLHKFNGWADVFLVTPQAGLEDLYLFADIDLPLAIKSRLAYHLFFSEDRSSDLGEEFDAVVSRKLTPNISVLAKAAIFFNGNRSYNLADRQKYWLQIELIF